MYLISVTQLPIQYCIAEYAYRELYFLTTKARKFMYTYIVKTLILYTMFDNHV
jgi:hypothetical protein